MKKVSQKRKLQFLLILITIWLSILFFYFFSSPDSTSERVLMCTKCNNIFLMKINSNQLEKYKCPKCGGAVGFAYKCSICDNQFPVIPKKNPFDPVKEKKRYLNFIIEERKCPNCGAIETFKMSYKFLQTPQLTNQNK